MRMTGTDGGGPCANITYTTRRGQTWDWDWDTMSGLAEYKEVSGVEAEGVVNCYPENSKGEW